MTTSMLRRLASSLMVLSLFAAAHGVRAETRAPTAATNPTTAAATTAAPIAVVPAAVVPAPVVPAPVAPGGVAAGTAAAAVESSKPADADTSDDPDWQNDVRDEVRDDDSRDDHGGSWHHSRHKRHGRHSDDVFNFGSGSHLPAGEHADSVVSIFGSSTSDGEAGDVVSILGDTRVTGPVGDNAVAVFGNTYVDSKIDGDAVAVLGNLELGPHAEIGGNAVSIGGTLHRDPAAIVHGDVENIFSGSIGNVGGLRIWIHQCLLYGRPLALAPGLGWAWGLALLCLAIYVGMALLFREGLFRCVETFEAQPGQAVLAALIAMLLTPVLIVLLCVTVIGIAAVPFVLAGLLCVSLFGKAVILAWVGRRVTSKHAAGTMSHPAIAVLIGGILVSVLYLVPVLGFVVYKILGLLGFGAVIYTLILAARTRQAGTSGGPASPTASATPPTHAASMTNGGPAASPASMANHTPAASAVSITTGTPAASGAAPADDGQSTASTADGTVLGAEGSTPPGGSTSSSAPSGSTASGGSGGGASLGGSASPGSAAAAPPHTPQSITAALPRAGFLRRMGALLIDVLLIGFLMGILHHAFRAELVILAAYGAIMWKLRGSTIGGLVLDLQVVRLDGREIDWPTAVVRALGCFLSLAVAGLGFFWIAFDPESQAWHDKIAGTVVVRVVKGTPLV